MRTPVKLSSRDVRWARRNQQPEPGAMGQREEGGFVMVRWKRVQDTTMDQMPADLWPDRDAWGSDVDEEKTRRRNAWLEDHDLSYEWFFVYVPAELEERRNVARLQPRPPARRKGELPESVRRLIAAAEQTE
jgi:hypothetical protein